MNTTIKYYLSILFILLWLYKIAAAKAEPVYTPRPETPVKPFPVSPLLYEDNNKGKLDNIKGASPEPINKPIDTEIEIGDDYTEYGINNLEFLQKTKPETDEARKEKLRNLRKKPENPWGIYGVVASSRSLGATTTKTNGVLNTQTEGKLENYNPEGEPPSGIVITEKDGEIYTQDQMIGTTIPMTLKISQAGVQAGFGAVYRKWNVRMQGTLNRTKSTGQSSNGVYNQTNTQTDNYLYTADANLKYWNNDVVESENRPAGGSDLFYYCNVPITTMQTSTSTMHQSMGMGAGSAQGSLEFVVFKDFMPFQNKKIRPYVGGGIILMSQSMLNITYNNYVQSKMNNPSAAYTDKFDIYKITGQDPLKGTATKPKYTEGCPDGSYTVNEPTGDHTPPNTPPTAAPPDYDFGDNTVTAPGVPDRDANGDDYYISITRPTPTTSDQYGMLYNLMGSFDFHLKNNIAPTVSLGLGVDISENITIDVGYKLTLYNFGSQTVNGDIQYQEQVKGTGDTGYGMSINTNPRNSLSLNNFYYKDRSLVISVRIYFF